MSQFFDELEQRLRDATAEQHARVARDMPAVRPRRRGRMRGHRHGRRLTTGALLALVLAGAVGTAVPTTRAAIGDAIGSVGVLSTYFDEADEHAAPDPSLRVPPVHLSFEELRDERGVLAETGGVRLFVTQKAGLVSIGISTARSAALSSATPAQWREQLAGHSVFLLRAEVLGGATKTVAGLASDAVASVELRHRQGPPQTVDQIDGGFVLLADAEREPYEVVVRDDAGEQLERVPVPVLPR